VLGGCAAWSPSSVKAPPRDSLADFSLQGRFSLRHEDKNYSGRLSWRHQGISNEVLLSSPFGQGMAEIVTGASGAQLTMSDGQVFAAEDTETLTQQVLGYPLPLTLLTDWVRGRAGAGQAERDGFGRLVRLRQAGWSIEYGYENDDVQAPPSRIFAQREGGMDLRLRIDEWRRLLPGVAQP
jgi:outer membrane lipoprotein LolB